MQFAYTTVSSYESASYHSQQYLTNDLSVSYMQYIETRVKHQQKYLSEFIKHLFVGRSRELLSVICGFFEGLLIIICFFCNTHIGGNPIDMSSSYFLCHQFSTKRTRVVISAFCYGVIVRRYGKKMPLLRSSRPGHRPRPH